MRKIISSIISLCLVSLALLANIYAWYTSNKAADANGVFVSCEKSNVMVGDYSILKYNKDTQEVDTTDAINLDDYDSIFESNNTNLAIIVCIPFETSESSLNVTFSCDGSVDDKCISNIIDFKLILPASDELETLTDNLSIYNYAKTMILILFHSLIQALIKKARLQALLI